MVGLQQILVKMNIIIGLCHVELGNIVDTFSESIIEAIVACEVITLLMKRSRRPRKLSTMASIIDSKKEST